MVCQQKLVSSIPPSPSFLPHHRPEPQHHKPTSTTNTTTLLVGCGAVVVVGFGAVVVPLLWASRPNTSCASTTTNTTTKQPHNHTNTHQHAHTHTRARHVLFPLLSGTPSVVMLTCNASSLPLWRHEACCPWRRQRRCFFRNEEEPCTCVKPCAKPVQFLDPTRDELTLLVAAFRRLAGSVMWHQGQAVVEPVPQNKEDTGTLLLCSSHHKNSASRSRSWTFPRPRRKS